MRIVIAGGPKVGKTTKGIELAKEHGLKLRHTDSLIHKMDWSRISFEVSRWLEDDGDWIIEGVVVPRALRKWLDRHKTGLPADRFLWSNKPRRSLDVKQRSMASGCQRVWEEILGELRRRGAKIEGWT